MRASKAAGGTGLPTLGIIRAFVLMQADALKLIYFTMKKISGLRKRWFCCVGIGLLTLCVAPRNISAGKLDPANWIIYNFSGPLITNLTGGPPLPPTGLHIVTTGTNNGVPSGGQTGPGPAANQLTNLTDGDLSSFVTLSSPSVLLVSLGQNTVVDRVYLVGSTKPTNAWVNYAANGATPPLGLIVVYVGNTPTTTNQVAAWTVPYDAGNPVETEADIRFSPTTGQFVRVELHTQVTWGTAYWPGSGLSTQPASTNVSWNVGELELYGFSGVAATETNLNAVVLPAGAAGPLAQAASDLSYYLGELTGAPYPIIPPAKTNQYSGTLFQILDMASLAPNYSTMMANIGNGQLPTNINATISGRVVTFKTWPYRSVLWSAWHFLESQGIRWVYPDPHGDYVPNTGLNLSVVPFQYTPPTYSIYANFDINELEPWPIWQLQSARQEFLYPWRNHWTFCFCGMGPLGGPEIPIMPAPNVTVNSEYTEAFVGYPHNFNSVVPPRILSIHTNWIPWVTTSPGSQMPVSSVYNYSPTYGGVPEPTFDDPTLISWVAQKMTNIAAAQPLACTWPLNTVHFHRPYNILPLDVSIYSKDPYSIASNGPPVPDQVPWAHVYSNSYSAAYYSLITAVANQVKALSPASVPLVGALAYADVFMPPTNIPALAVFPTNVQVEVCVYGAPGLLMSDPANAPLKAAFDGWHSACSHLANYDYELLHTDYYEPDPRLPVPLVAGIVSRAQYFASIGALDGGTQGSLTSLPYNPWNFYAYPRIRWNTNQTPAQLEQEFFTGYFREAAAPMLAYYQIMENYQVTNSVDMHLFGCAYAVTPGSFPIGILAQMQTNLVAAEQLATNWWVVSRVADMAAGFDWIITNSPDGLHLGQDFTETSPYPLLNPSTNGTTVALNQLTAPKIPILGNNAYVQTDGTWFMGAPAQVQGSFNITAGTYRLDLLLNGGASPAGWPTMKAFLGPASGSAQVNSSSNATYSFTFTVPAGVYDLVIQDPNYQPGNFVIHGIQITRL